MRFARGDEFFFDAQMHFQRAALEPASAAPRQMRRLGMLPDAEDARIECARFGFAPGRLEFHNEVQSRPSKVARARRVGVGCFISEPQAKLGFSSREALSH